MAYTTGTTVCLFALAVVSCKAYVDKYVWHYDSFKDGVQTVAKEGFSYDQEHETLIKSYTGAKGKDCRGKLNKEGWVTTSFGVLQALLIDLNQEGEHIDTITFEAVGKCGGEKTCEDKALKDGNKQLTDLQGTYKTKMDKFKTATSNQVKEFMDTCTKC